ncbi:MAG TPA: hypothetical protein DCO75_08165 [Fibrobacteres bacterium]|nr:hypothetical protein [Fibrobacterota bacterium]
MSIFETGMLICFGVSWPVSILKTIKTKQVAGKSPLFLIIICAGYICGIIHKALFSNDWVIILYIINLFLVSIDCFLYFYFSKRLQKK